MKYLEKIGAGPLRIKIVQATTDPVVDSRNGNVSLGLQIETYRNDTKVHTYDVVCWEAQLLETDANNFITNDDFHISANEKWLRRRGSGNTLEGGKGRLD